MRRSADSDLRILYQLTRLLRDPEPSPEQRVSQLYEFLFKDPEVGGSGYVLSPLSDWDIESLRRAVYFSEEISVLYAFYYFNSNVIPVTFYKRERRIRRHLDQQFSLLYAELKKRTGETSPPELITQEPIYYLQQKVREKNFPHSRDGKPSLETLKQRFHLELSRRLGPEDPHEGTRRVLLPHEIR